MSVTIRFTPRGAVVEGAEELTPHQRLQAVAALTAQDRATRGEGAPRIVLCIWCGREVVGKSAKRRYCSVRCRVAASRAKSGPGPLVIGRPGGDVMEQRKDGYAVKRLWGG